ncbi:DUF397 domain-containing protein [Saccharopolyspora sp. TS4A08]|uniref:DUF397 domain-containing protein n=1 Tax=Saccharopolyspora ipomoeae TaxID=3042027 RepID=A0ABT6PP36_9PSEU|nr:DUF397 domain-containing protein [Saccharopolyspora sp. TS4A08]MDI2029761.1 DUF397 domain-containing protein [Saccharopolyspora sp. TS4A08]
MTANPARWRASSRSQNLSSRLEVGPLRPGVAVRNSSRRENLTASAEQWRSFVNAVKAGRFDR